MLNNNVAVPKIPESKGRRGSFTGRFRARYPRIPARRNTIRDCKNSSSLRTKYREAKIRINGIIEIIVCCIFGSIKMNIGTNIIIIGRAIREPYNVRITA